LHHPLQQQAYLGGNPIMPNDEFDALKQKLKVMKGLYSFILFSRKRAFDEPIG
jgi:hypothetical protein